MELGRGGGGRHPLHAGQKCSGAPEIPLFARLVTGVAGVLGLIALIVFGSYTYLSMPMTSEADAKAIVVVVNQGMDAGAIAATLEEQGIIRSASHFRFFNRILGTDKKLQAGEYLLTTDLTIPRILHRLQHGQVISQRVAIPEGLHLRQIANLLAERNLVDRDRFLTVAQNEALVYGSNPPFNKPVASLEGYLFPDTYLLTSSMTEEQIVRIMVDRFVEVALPVLQSRPAPAGLSLHEVVTLASIVEKEALFRREHPVIASVFLNRLRINMPLQADPTVAYLFDEHRPRLLFADLELVSPYNTYRNRGLPPGPIASPGLSALQGVLEPDETEYLYFVARGDGTHVFTRTFNEHVREANRMRR